MTPRDDADRLGTAVTVCFRAAAHLAEASVLFRWAARHADDDLANPDEEFDLAVESAGDALERAAAELERAVHILSKTDWAAAEETATEVESIRIDLRSLNAQSAHFTRRPPVHRQTADEGDESDAQDASMLAWILSDRADTFRMKASEMAGLARMLLAAAHMPGEADR